MTRWFRAGLVALAAGGALALPIPSAQAIPDDGAGANTPGTSSSLAPRTLRAGDTVSFTLSGFPAGETVYLKIDDGRSCSAASVHGACVVHLQRISANGTVSGSFALPTDLKPGTHWLRFLASAEVRDADGTYQGIKGYTRRSPDFTVTAGATASSGNNGSSADNGSNNAGNDSGSGTDEAGLPGSTSSAAGGVQSATADQALVAPAMPAAATDVSTETEPAPASEGSAVSAGPRVAASEDRFPYLGAGALALCLLASAWLLVRGRRRVTLGG